MRRTGRVVSRTQKQHEDELSSAFFPHRGTRGSATHSLIQDRQSGLPRQTTGSGQRGCWSSNKAGNSTQTCSNSGPEPGDVAGWRLGPTWTWHRAPKCWEHRRLIALHTLKGGKPCCWAGLGVVCLLKALHVRGSPSALGHPHGAQARRSGLLTARRQQPVVPERWRLLRPGKRSD